jgi:flagella basal body P-ring formation protein FlgA
MLGFVFRNRVRLRAIYGPAPATSAQKEPPPVVRRGQTVVLRPKGRRRA